MIISQESFRNIKKRKYFPLFIFEYYKQCIYNVRQLKVSKKYGRKFNAYNIIGGAFDWHSSLKGWAYWEDKYNNEVNRAYDELPTE